MRRFNRTIGFGFIEAKTGGRGIFVHISALKRGPLAAPSRASRDLRNRYRSRRAPARPTTAPEKTDAAVRLIREDNAEKKRLRPHAYARPDCHGSTNAPQRRLLARRDREVDRRLRSPRGVPRVFLRDKMEGRTWLSKKCLRAGNPRPPSLRTIRAMPPSLGITSSGGCPKRRVTIRAAPCRAAFRNDLSCNTGPEFPARWLSDVMFRVNRSAFATRLAGRWSGRGKLLPLCFFEDGIDDLQEQGSSISRAGLAKARRLSASVIVTPLHSISTP
ncbi:hypothetical protein BMG03_02645 [Thioclava nitratireducens]|uniref:CSD domain-containing protein n=2 Tax=Thioclava TaxID=285107 RepID=A0ABM6IDJ5_9RHOB|nr:hypothetical protein BMG03_02645 [Thioclava nitratireducens]